MYSASSCPHKLIIACITISIAFAAAADPGPDRGLEKAAERSGKTFDRQAALEKRWQMHQWLMSERVSPGQAKKIEVVVSDEEMARVDKHQGALPVRVGLTKALDADVSFNDVGLGQLRGRSLSRPHGAMTGTTDGGWVYTAELESPEAAALRVQFTGFRLPEGAGIYLYNSSGQVFGPYTGRGPHGDGEFWSHTLVGESVTLQLRQVGPGNTSQLQATGFKISGLAHIRPRYMTGHCSENGRAWCSVNPECLDTSSVVDIARDAVAHMQWVSGAWVYFCSGGLIADTDPAIPERPLFLTANHCLSRKKEARSLENFFQLTAPCGTTSCDDYNDHRAGHLQELRTLGATVLSTDVQTDHTLLKLNDPAPPGSAFLGWYSQPVDTSTGLLYRVHHPGSSPQSYSEHIVDPDSIVCSGWPRGKWIYSTDLVGATEGGSSGSPVVNAAGQVVGQLTGGCGYGGTACDYANFWTVDGAFAAYFDQVRQYLDPSCTATEEPEVSCNDNQDNDCDGAIDDDDSDCDGGEPQSCTSHAQCPAGTRCKGRRGAKVCS
jgi:hypothetical protein